MKETPGSFSPALLRRRAGLGIVAAGLLLGALAACDDAGPIESLRTMPEAALAFPGSIIVKDIATPRFVSPDGRSGATLGHLFGANASADEVVAWFDQALRSRGWHQAGTTSRGDSLAVVSWTNDQAVFRLAINRPDRLTPDIQAKLVGYSIEYDARLREIYPLQSG